MDTFPTPMMVGFWPRVVVAKTTWGYSFENSSGVSGITEANKAAAAFLGLQHQGWHNIGSAWFGPAARIIRLDNLI